MEQHLKTVKYSSRKKGKIIWNVIFIVYLAVLLRITVFRSGFLIEHLWSGTVNLSLFQSYLPLIRDQNWMRIVYLFGGNIVWFVPFGMYLQGSGRITSIGKTALAGLVFSFTIEFSQYLFGTGVSELVDLCLYTFGGWLVAVFVRMIKKIFRVRK